MDSLALCQWAKEKYLKGVAPVSQVGEKLKIVEHTWKYVSYVDNISRVFSLESFTYIFLLHLNDDNRVLQDFLVKEILF